MKPQTSPDTPEDPLGTKLLVQITPHLKELAKTSPAVRKEFYPSLKENHVTRRALIDPLLEDQFIKTPGLIHKYPKRVLITLTMTCAAYCRFCTRRRVVSDIVKGHLTKTDVDNMATYLTQTKSVNEVIFSGGDPVTVPRLLIYAINKIKSIPHINILRIHTRTPVSRPTLITPTLLKTINSAKQPLYVSIHFEHPDEFTPATLKAVAKLKSAGAILLCQSVFLKGINDSYQTLYKLYSRLPELGIRPYYIYHCDPTAGVEHFIVPLKKEIEIMTKLRANLSGLSTPTHVIDTPNGSGKIPVPMGFWNFDPSHFRDFLNKSHLT